MTQKITSANIWQALYQIALGIPDIPMATFSQWKGRGFIPPSRHYDFIHEAQRRGWQTLTHKMLHDQWLRNAPINKSKNRKKVRYI